MRNKILEFIFENENFLHLNTITFLNQFEASTANEIKCFLKTFKNLQEKMNEATISQKNENLLKEINSLILKTKALLKEITPNLQFVLSSENESILNNFQIVKREFKVFLKDNWVILIEAQIHQLIENKNDSSIKSKKLLKKEFKLEKFLESLSEEQLQKIDQALLQKANFIKN